MAIARSYNDTEDGAIEVEFHDASVHHAIHVPNTLNHHLADVSAEALLLGCESSEQFPRLVDLCVKYCKDPVVTHLVSIQNWVWSLCCQVQSF